MILKSIYLNSFIIAALNTLFVYLFINLSPEKYAILYILCRLTRKYIFGTATGIIMMSLNILITNITSNYLFENTSENTNALVIPSLIFFILKGTLYGDLFIFLILLPFEYLITLIFIQLVKIQFIKKIILYINIFVCIYLLWTSRDIFNSFIEKYYDTIASCVERRRERFL